MELQKKLVNFNIARLLKKIGFNVAVPHCYIHESGEDYYLELFAFYRVNTLGELTRAFENEKKIRFFSDTHFITNEDVTYFDYNQDLRKILARAYHGEEYMNDERSYNMIMDSYSHEKLSAEEEEELKLTLPNYNDGDFEFTTYRDVISAPEINDVIDWFSETFNIEIEITLDKSLNDINNNTDNIKSYLVTIITKEKTINYKLQTTKIEAKENAINYTIYSKLFEC